MSDREGPENEFFFQTLEAIAGIGAVDALSRNFGGTRIYIPRKQTLSAESRLAQAWGGLDAANAIIEKLGPIVGGGYLLDVPMRGTGMRATVRARIREMLSDGGVSVEQIALRVGVTARTVFRHKQRLLDEGVNLPPSQPPFKNKFRTTESNHE